MFKAVSALPYIGCYTSSNTFDVFSQPSILSLSQCNAAAFLFSGVSCDTNGAPYYEVYSSSMSAELCIQICVTTFGFAYGALNTGYLSQI